MISCVELIEPAAPPAEIEPFVVEILPELTISPELIPPDNVVAPVTPSVPPTLRFASRSVFRITFKSP